MFEWLFSGWFGAADLFHLLTDWSLDLEDFVTVVFIVALCFFIRLIFIEFSHSATWFACVELVIGGLMPETRQGKSIICGFFFHILFLFHVLLSCQGYHYPYMNDQIVAGESNFLYKLCMSLRIESSFMINIFCGLVLRQFLLWTCAKPVSSVDLC